MEYDGVESPELKAEMEKFGAFFQQLSGAMAANAG